MDNTKIYSKLSNKSKKFIKYSSNPLKAPKRLLSKRSVASAPVRRQLPCVRLAKLESSVERMRAYLNWSTNNFALSKEEAIAKKDVTSYSISMDTTSSGSNSSKVLLRRRSEIPTLQQPFSFFAPLTTQSFYSFVNWYCRTYGVEETRQWKTVQRKKLARWLKYADVLGVKSSKNSTNIKRSRQAALTKTTGSLFARPTAATFLKYAPTRAASRAQYRVSRGISPLEAKIRSLQKRMRQWHSLHPQVSNVSPIIAEHVRVCTVLSRFVTRFKTPCCTRHAVRRVQKDIKQVLLKIMPKKYSSAMLARLSRKQQLQYVIAWKGAFFLWQFLSPNVSVKVPSVTSLIKCKRMAKTHRKLAKRLKAKCYSPLTGVSALQTSWLDYGTKQKALLVRDAALKIKKVGCRYVLRQPKTSRPFWRKKGGSHLFRISRKERKLKRVRRMKLKYINVKTSVTPVVFQTFLKRSFSTKVEIKLNKGHPASRSRRGQKTVRMYRWALSPIKHCSKYRLRRSYITLFTFFKRRLRRLDHSGAANFLRLLSGRIAQRKWLRRCRYIYRTQLLRRWEKRRYVRHCRRRRRAIRAYRRGAVLVGNTASQKARKRRPLPLIKAISSEPRPLVKNRLISAFRYWLRARVARRKRRVLRRVRLRARTRGLKLSLNRRKKSTYKLVEQQYFITKTPSVKKLRVQTLNAKLPRKNTQIANRKKLYTRRVLRIISQLHWQRKAKREIRQRSLNTATLPFILPTLDSPSPFDISALRRTVGWNRKKQLKKAIAVRSWNHNVIRANERLARIFPVTRLSVTSSNSAQRITSAHAARVSQSRLIELPALCSVDSFPFKRVDSQERLQSVLKEKRINAYRLRLRNRTADQQSDYSTAHARLGYLTGFVQKLDRLSSIDKNTVRYHLLRTNALLGVQARQVASKKLKSRVRTSAINNSLHALGHRAWAQKLRRSLKVVNTIKQSFPRRGRKCRRYKRGLKWRLSSLFYNPRKSKKGRKLKALALLRKGYSKLSLRTKVWRSERLRPIKIGAPVHKIQKITKLRTISRTHPDLIWHTLQRNSKKNWLTRTPYLSPQYRIKARLLTKVGRVAPSKEEYARRKRVNRLRKHLAVRIYLQRRADADKWNKKNRPFRRQARLGREEKLKRNLHKLRWTSLMDVKTGLSAGYPAVTGCRRIRRVFISKFTGDLNQSPAAISLPHHNPIATTALSMPNNLYAVHTRNNKRIALLLRDPLSSKKTRNVILPGCTKSSAFFTSERIWDGNIGWRFLKPGGPSINTRETAAQVVTALLLTLEQNAPKFAKAWQAYAEKTSVKDATYLRFAFTAGAARWLQERPIERLTSSWTLNDWFMFRKFSITASGLTENAHENIKDFKRNFIATSRQELFAHSPSWLKEQFVVRVNLLTEAMQTGHSPAVILDTVTTAAAQQELFVSQAGLGWQHKKLFVFSAVQTTSSDYLSFKSMDLNTSAADLSRNMTKRRSSVYYSWFDGLDSHLKKTCNVRASSSGNALGGDAVDIGLNRPRFPGSGRKKFTFDSRLRAHYRKTMPLRFRRLLSPQLKTLRPDATLLFTSRLLKFTSTSSTQRGLRFIKQGLSHPYPTKRKRELLNRFYMFKNKKPLISTQGSKVKFSASPVYALSGARTRYMRKLRSTVFSPATADSEVLLQRALQRRYGSRVIRDLRKSGRRRKLPRQQIKPFWVQWRVAKKKALSDRYDAYALPSTGGYVPAVSSQWVCSDFSLGLPRANRCTTMTTTPEGEVILSQGSVGRKISRWHSPALRLKGGPKRWKTRYERGTKRLYQCKLIRKRFRWKKIKRVRSSIRYLRRKQRHQSYEWKRPPAIKSVKGVLNKLEVAHRKAHYRFTKMLRPSDVAAPLHFRKCATRMSISAAEKARWQQHVQSTRQRKYRRLAEQSSTLTRLFPQLISYFVTKKMHGKMLSSREVANLVQSVYWNIRVYLQHDYEQLKSLGREDNTARIQELEKEITTASLERFFNFAELTATRYRFQPHKLHPGVSLMRGAAEWQRRFLPKFYELNLEDPNKYGHLAVTPLKIFRASLSCKKISDWETRKIPGLMENRFARLTTKLYGKNSNCFENMLMTTRRAPITAGYGSAATLKVTNFGGTSPARKPFFRQFTTKSYAGYQHFKSEAASLVSVRMETIRRQTATEIQPLPYAQAVAAHGLLKRVGHERARSQQVSSAGTTGFGSIDVRLLRAKSPRNAEYLQRVSPAAAGLKAVTSPYVERNHAEIPVFRSTRANIAHVSAGANESLLKNSSCTSLRKLRGFSRLRRVPSFLQISNKLYKSSGAVLPPRRLFTARLAARQRNKRTAVTIFRRGTASCEKSVRPLHVIKTFRSVLHFRKASMRTRVVHHRRTPVVLQRSIRLSPATWNLLKQKRFDRYLCEKAQQQALRFKRKQRLAIFTEDERRRLRLPMGRYRKVLLYRNRILPGSKTIAFKRRTFSPAWKRTNSMLGVLRQTNKGALRSKRLSSHFCVRAKQIRRNTKVVSQYVNGIEKTRSNVLFLKQRSRLWENLSTQKMKKFRLLKYWLKTIKYSFKHKIWGVDGQPALPDVLFKLARLRLRKLEWRERDDRFDRPDFKGAFTFNPRERRNARWLEALMYRRSLYNHRRGQFRRDQLPREQKSRKWMQQLRKMLYRRKPTHLYIRRRQWPVLRQFNQRLHRSVFHISTSKAMLKRFRKLARRKPSSTGFEKLMSGFGNRLDVTLMLLNIAPTTFWAREIAPMGLFRVNGKIVRKANFRFMPGDHIEFLWDKLQKLRSHFTSFLKRHDRARLLQVSSLSFPGNFLYNPTLRTAQYIRLPRADDLTESSRINARLFRWSQLDSGVGK